jgi:hypothetical protein
LNPIKHLWRDLKIAVKQRSPSNLTELERICREEWEKLPNLVAPYPRRFKVVIDAKGASTKYRVKGLNTYVNVMRGVVADLHRYVIESPVGSCPPQRRNLRWRERTKDG